MNPIEIQNCILTPPSSVSPSLLPLTLLAHPQARAHLCMLAHTREAMPLKKQERRNVGETDQGFNKGKQVQETEGEGQRRNRKQKEGERQPLEGAQENWQRGREGGEGERREKKG